LCIASDIGLVQTETGKLKTKKTIMQSGRNYLITGPTGNVGKRVAEQLLSQGHRVRVFGRNRERLQQLVDMVPLHLSGTCGTRRVSMKHFEVSMRPC